MKTFFNTIFVNDSMDDKPNENFETLWTVFSKTVELWQNYYLKWQETGQEAFKLYLDGISISVKNDDFYHIKKYNIIWEQAVKNMNLTLYPLYYNSWSDIWKKSGFVTFEEFNNYWKNLSDNFGENVKKFSEESLKKLQPKQN
jgi:hypothetical protein